MTVLRPRPWDWPGPRVLLEQPFDEETLARIDALRRAGYAVSICPGPVEGDRCPLAGEDGCAAAQGADVVVSALDRGAPASREVLEAMRHRLPRLPVLVLDEAVEPDDLVARVREVLDA